MGQTFYKIHLPALSYAECWKVAKNPVEFLIAATLKTIGVSFTPQLASTFPHRLIRVTPDSLDPVLARLLETRLEEARAIGIDDGIWYTCPAIGAASIVGSAFRLPDGCGALVIVAVHLTHNGITTDNRSRASFVTELANGRAIATSPEKPDLTPPPTVECEYMPRATLSVAFDRHRDRLSLTDERIVKIISEDDIEDFCIRNEKANCDYNVERGVFVPVTAAEEATLRAAMHTVSADTPVKSAKGLLDILCWLSIGFGVFKLGDDAPNDAQLIFRWSLVVGGFVGLALLAVVRHFRQAE